VHRSERLRREGTTVAEEGQERLDKLAVEVAPVRGASELDSGGRAGSGRHDGGKEERMKGEPD